MLTGSGSAIYFMRLRSDNLKGRYPPTSCNTAREDYSSDMKNWAE